MADKFNASKAIEEIHEFYSSLETEGHLLDATNSELAKRQKRHELETVQLKTLMYQLSAQLEANTAITVEVKNILTGTRALINVLGWMIPIGKWILTVSAVILLMWSVLKGRPSVPGFGGD